MTAGNTQFVINGVQYTITLKAGSLNGATISGQFNIAQGNVVVIENFVYQLDTLNGQIVGNGTTYPLTDLRLHLHDHHRRPQLHRHHRAERDHGHHRQHRLPDQQHDGRRRRHHLSDPRVPHLRRRREHLPHRPRRRSVDSHSVHALRFLAIHAIDLHRRRDLHRQRHRRVRRNQLLPHDGHAAAVHRRGRAPTRCAPTRVSDRGRPGARRTSVRHRRAEPEPVHLRHADDLHRPPDRRRRLRRHSTTTPSPTTSSPTPTPATPTRSAATPPSTRATATRSSATSAPGAYFEVPGGPTYYVNIPVADTGTASGDIFNVFPVASGGFTMPLRYTITVAGGVVTVNAFTFTGGPTVVPTLTAVGSSLTGGYFIDPVTKITYTCVVDGALITFVDSNNTVYPFPAAGTTNQLIATVVVATGVTVAVDNQATPAIYPGAEQPVHRRRGDLHRQRAGRLRERGRPVLPDGERPLHRAAAPIRSRASPTRCAAAASSRATSSPPTTSSPSTATSSTRSTPSTSSKPPTRPRSRAPSRRRR